MAYTEAEPGLDSPIDEFELSVRAIGVAKRAGYTTLRQVRDNLDLLKKHHKGCGQKTVREIQDMVRYAERKQNDLFQNADFVRDSRNRAMTAASYRLSEVQHILMRIAISQTLTPDAKRSILHHLLEITKTVESLPVIGQGETDG